MATAAKDGDSFGPLEEYDRRVHDGLLRNDEHQRGEDWYTNEHLEH